MSSLAAVPHELLLNILRHALTTSLISEPLLVHGQFAHLTVTCRTCAYRQVASVCRLWRAIAQEVLGKGVTFANGCGSAERDELVVKAVEHDPWRASNVRHVDVSLRRAVCSWGAPLPGGGAGGESSEEAVLSGGEDAFISSREVQAERWHAQCLARCVPLSPVLERVERALTPSASTCAQRATALRPALTALQAHRDARHRRRLLPGRPPAADSAAGDVARPHPPQLRRRRHVRHPLALAQASRLDSPTRTVSLCNSHTLQRTS